MPTNQYVTASAILRLLFRAENRIALKSDLMTGLSRAQRPHLDSALDLLSRQGDVEIYPSPDPRGAPGQCIRLIQNITPDPHCPTCTCNDVL